MVKKILLNLRYFLWVLSGSDIKTLKENPTDHNRHANIGLTILVTTFVAFCTGTLAGYEFGNNTLRSAFIFGFIWSLLVFTIDRTMVLTLKKDPKLSPKERIKRLTVPIIYRVFLSALISFFVSIPLELWLFRENIKVQLDIDKNEQLTKKRERENNIYNISGLEENITSIEEEKTEMDSLLTQFEAPSNYKNYAVIKQQLDQSKTAYEKLKITYANKVNQRKLTWNEIPVYYLVKDSLQNNPQQNKQSSQYKKWQALWLETKATDGSLTQQLALKKQSYQELINQQQRINHQYFKQIQNRKEILDSLNIKTTIKLTQQKNIIDENTEDFQELIVSQEGFTTKWIAINNIDDFWIIFFIWFIRLVFFTIEMLPTMSKITTPIGAYDWSIYNLEEKKKHASEKIEDLETKKTEKMEALRLNVELETQKRILEELGKKQVEIAKTVIEKWEKEQKKKMGRDISTFIETSDKDV